MGGAALSGFFALLVIGVLVLEGVHRVPLVAHLIIVGAVIALLDVVIQNVFVRWLPAIFGGR